MKYRFDGKEKLLSFGTYPEIGFKEASERRDAARSILADGRDPGAVKHEQKQVAALKDANAFEIVAREFAEKQTKRWTERHPISSICYETGFADISHFNRTFRRRFGTTPSEVRAAMKADLS